MIRRCGQPLGLGHGDVVLGQDGDHGVAHAQHPAADRDQHDRAGRQDQVDGRRCGRTPSSSSGSGSRCRRGGAGRDPSESRGRRGPARSPARNRETSRRRAAAAAARNPTKPPRRQAPNTPSSAADDEAEDRGGQPEQQRPVQAGADDVGHRRRERDDRDAEIAPQDMGQIGQVLLGQRRVGEAEGLPHRLDLFRLQPARGTRAKIAEAGSPGIKRGRKKLSVSDAQAASR